MESGKATNAEEYIAAFPPAAAGPMTELLALVRAAAPDATERLSYGMPSFQLNGRNLLYFAGYARHVGFYPGESTIEAFETELEGYKHRVGSVQLPLDRPFPTDLVRRMIEFTVTENRGRAKGRAKGR